MANDRYQFLQGKRYACEMIETLRNLAAYVTEVARERSTGRGPATAGETMTEQETGQEGTVR